MEEEWRKVQGYDYLVSNLGNVKSIKRDKIKSPSKSPSGYLKVALYKDGVSKNHYVSRLVASAFIDNPDPEKNNVVNHLDCNPLNNRVDNLEWTTQSQNIKYAYEQGTKIPSEQHNHREIWCVNNKNVVECTYESSIEAGKALSVPPSTIYSACSENPLKRVIKGFTLCFRDYLDKSV